MSTSQLLLSTRADPRSSGYTLLLAEDEGEVRAAQRLRHRVFAGEMGAVLHSPYPGLDVDAYDAYCDHLLVREDRTGEIVGTYRMLPPQRARDAGGLYCDTEFDAAALDPLRPELVETGRSCVHPGHRTGAVVNLVWAGIARYLLLTGRRWLVGCASVPLRTAGQPDGAFAAGVWDIVRERHLGRRRCAPCTSGTPTRPHAPSGRCCRRCCGATSGSARSSAARRRTTPTFGVADLLVLLDVHTMDERYLRHFLGATA